MKKIFFGSAAAICAIVGLSSFKETSMTTAAFWFVPTSIFPITPFWGGDVFENPSQSISGAIKVVAVDANQSIQTEEPDMCFGNLYYCHIGFTATQVTDAGFNLKLKGTVGQTSNNFSLTGL